MRGRQFLEVSLTNTASPDHGELLRAAMSASNWRRPDLSLNRSSSEARQTTMPYDSESWRDELLTEIEDLVGQLKAKVARYSLLRSDPSLQDPLHPDNRAATDWMHGALEDIAATALGIELATQERIFRAISDVDRDATIESNQEPKTGTAG
ncbi:hypothetical protein ACVLB3_002315 [Pseudarthrobacter sp. PvP022]